MSKEMPLEETDTNTSAPPNLAMLACGDFEDATSCADVSCADGGAGRAFDFGEVEPGTRRFPSEPGVPCMEAP